MAFYHMQMQQENIDTGQYQVTVSDRLNNRPIENARVRISYTGAPDSTIEEVATDPPDALLLSNLRLHLWNTVWNRLNNSPTQNIPFRSKQKDLNQKKSQEARY